MFAVLVHQVSDSLYSVAYRILRDTGLAEDALQNALVAIVTGTSAETPAARLVVESRFGKLVVGRI